MPCPPVDRDYFLLGVGSWATGPKSPVRGDGRAKAPIPASSTYVLPHNQDVLAQHAPQPEASPTRGNESREHCPPSPGTTIPKTAATTATTTTATTTAAATAAATTVTCAKPPPAPETSSDLQTVPEPPAQQSLNKKTLQTRSPFPVWYPAWYPPTWEEITVTLWHEKTWEWIRVTVRPIVICHYETLGASSCSRSSYSAVPLLTSQRRRVQKIMELDRREMLGKGGKSIMKTLGDIV
ncbi:hypothetical protein B0T19DRAFT_429004 [Cercophora scortea]|uniref:Uncharacterized protein n=1 Tax=Cercophora scortea TaxID=314031 RepID=A0AAE0IGT2_9PEZI|nr:hypothetical protein B0T19DRAFT_429004 [Cercophora scortea]